MDQIIGLIVIVAFIYFVVKKVINHHAAPKPIFTKIEKIRDSTRTKGRCDDSAECITGFYGSTEYSPNKEYCVTYIDGHYYNEKWKNGEIALLHGSELLFRKKLQRPNDCHVSDDGIVICCDWLHSEALMGNFQVFDVAGNRIFAKKTTANLGACAISADSKTAIFETFRSETADSNQLFLIDVERKTIFNRFPCPHSFNSAEIDTINHRIKLKDHRGFVFEIDYDGHQTNHAAYESRILRDGSIYDKLSIYESKTDDARLNDRDYLHLLRQALDDKNASYSFGKDRLYRRIGEFYEAAGDIGKTIENWEKALAINPKVGVKRKLEALKRAPTTTNK
jgi:tetratricopeptide (TPR) repeat protein